MRTRCLLLCLSMVALLATPSIASQHDQPNIGPVDVKVQLRPQGEGQPRRIVIGPRAAGVCRYADDCSDHFTITWIGSKKDGEKIRIRFTTPGAAECLDKSNFTIDDTGPGNKQTVTLNKDNPVCEGKFFFFFEVSCEGGEGNETCGGVEIVDPGAMVDGGRRGG